MPTIRTAFSVCLLACGLTVTAAAQGPDAVPPADEDSAPIVRALPALTYPEGRNVRLKFQGTARLPGARGEARVQRKRGHTEIEIKLKEMKPALLFGGDYNTYVLWTVSPEGIVHNGGEFILRGSNSELNVSTPLITFGMLVTAEPHFLVEAPSPFSVLEPTREVEGGAPTPLSIQYREFDRGYSALNGTLANEPQTEGEFRVDRQQAMTAVALAERAEAERFAPQELALAREALRTTIAALGRGDPEQMTALAHRTVRLAVEAERLARDRARQTAIDKQIRDLTEHVAQLETSLGDATQTRKQAALEVERYRDEAANLKVQLEETRNQMQNAQREARRLSYLESKAQTEADRARQESEEIRMRMHDALGRVADTRETARGLVVNLPDILFDSGKSTLRTPAKEILSRVAGILLVTPGYRLSVEGHTDSVGGQRFNQRLSENRAQAVHDYLVEAGISSDIITTAGFGESNPIASNRTRAGRQQNRRVEILIQNTGSAAALPQ